MASRLIFWPRLKTAFPRSDIPVEPALIQVRIRKHNIALPIANILLPFLPIHGTNNNNDPCYNLPCFPALTAQSDALMAVLNL
jgi:hypothetical protein